MPALHTSIIYKIIYISHFDIYLFIYKIICVHIDLVGIETVAIKASEIYDASRG